MLLPSNFKGIIASTFYDKDINILNNTETLDAEGGRKKVAGEILSTFKGNVRYTNLNEIQEDYGLNYQIDIAISTHNTDVKVDDIVSYNNIKYVVTDAIPTDSHVLLVANKYGNSRN